MKITPHGAHDVGLQPDTFLTSYLMELWSASRSGSFIPKDTAAGSHSMEAGRFGEQCFGPSVNRTTILRSFSPQPSHYTDRATSAIYFWPYFPVNISDCEIVQPQSIGSGRYYQSSSVTKTTTSKICPGALALARVIMLHYSHARHSHLH
jgi:hypothetical protein